MSTVWRDVDTELRLSRAQSRFAASAYGARNWLSDLEASRPLLAAIDEMPDAPDVLALLDPLQGSALTHVAQASRSLGDAEKAVAESHGSIAGMSAHTMRPVPMATRFTAADSRAVRPSAAQVRASTSVPAASIAAQVAAMLARHEHLREPVAEHAVQRTPLADAGRDERRIVPFAPQRAGADEAGPRSEAAGLRSPLHAMLARWTGIAAAEPAQRLEAATGRVIAEHERTQLDSALASLHVESVSTGAVPVSESSRSLEPELVRLADLAAPLLLRDAQREHARPPVEASEATNAPLEPAAPGESVLGRVATALARIEEHLAAPAPSTEPAMQWLTEDDTLAERIHDILRRQAQRHGIDAP